MSKVLPHIGAFSPTRRRFNTARDWSRAHLPWITTVLLLGSVVSFVFSARSLLGFSLGAVGVGLLIVALLVNAMLVLSDRAWEPVEILGARGLTMIDDWLEINEDWIEPVAHWIYECGHLDTRHFMCLRRMIEGPRAQPLGSVTGQWVLWMRTRSKEMCSSPANLADGRMLEALERVRVGKMRETLGHHTQNAPCPPRPRPRL